MNMTPALSPSVPPMARRFFRYVDLFDVSLSEADAAGKGIGVARGQDGLGESPEWTFDRRRAIVILFVTLERCVPNDADGSRARPMGPAGRVPPRSRQERLSESVMISICFLIHRS
jgi:hypothetical protein